MTHYYHRRGGRWLQLRRDNVVW